MTGPNLLAEAARTIAGRRREYGSPRPLFEQVARRWSMLLGVPVSPEQVILALIDLKLARLAYDPGHRDSARDVAGYAAVLAELAHSAGEPK